MKIAHIACTFPPYKGGIGNATFNLAVELGRLKNDVTVFTPAYDDQSLSINGFNLIRLNPLLKYGNAAFLPQLFYKLKSFDIIHLHYPFFGGAEAVWLYKFFNGNRKLVIQYHMDVNSLPLPLKFFSIPSYLTLNSLLNYADAITCASFDYIKHSNIQSYFNNHINKFFEIPFGVDSDLFKPDKRWLNKKNSMLFVGALDKAHDFKGLDVLFSSLKKLKINIRLQVVGGGNMLSYYKKLAQSMEVSCKVEFLGRVEDKNLPKIYNNNDFLVLPSTSSHEAFGLVLLEAMSSGLPVIASDLPGVRSVFHEGVEGLLARPGDPEDLARKIAILEAGHDGWLEKSKSARKLVEEKYLWKKSALSLNNLYKDILNERLPDK